MKNNPNTQDDSINICAVCTAADCKVEPDGEYVDVFIDISGKKRVARYEIIDILLNMKTRNRLTFATKRKITDEARDRMDLGGNVSEWSLYGGNEGPRLRDIDRGYSLKEIRVGTIPEVIEKASRLCPSAVERNTGPENGRDE